MLTPAHTDITAVQNYYLKITEFTSLLCFCLYLCHQHKNSSLLYHHRENNSSSGGFDDPKEDQAAELNDGKQMNLPQRNMSQVDKVWLVFCWHPKQFQTIKELRRKKKHAT